jgi:alpha-galactosidase
MEAFMKQALPIFCAFLCTLWPLEAWSASVLDIPMDAPEDAVMASPAEVRSMLDWASAVWTGNRPADRQPLVRVEVRRQDHSVLRFGQSCIETPIRIGQREFQHGLGTHANSELVLHLPRGAKAFQAWVGIDNNSDTGGQRGSVQFVIVAGGGELFRSATRRGNDEPLPVRVDLPPDTPELVLKVDGTADGVAHDQADWADAQVELEDGSVVWADEDRQGFLSPALPFSFIYDGVNSADLLNKWARTSDTRDDRNRIVHVVHWTDPGAGLRVTATVTAFKRYPAAEWVLEFENTGTNDTPILENIQALDAELRTGYFRKPAVLHQISGDVCGEQSFLPRETSLELAKPVVFAPVGGRSSNQTFPFFNLQYGDEGLITAIGWSGQWSASLLRSDRGPTRLRAGLEKTHLRLHPGERIRSPRILVMTWKGDRMLAHNRFRRLLLFEYVPKQDGRPIRMPVALQCFDRYSSSRPEWSTEAGQIRAVQAADQLGFDTHWFDAAWFEGGFPNGVGNWFCKPKEFPRGLKPVSAACRERGLKFLVWFEPERVAAGTQIAREHPDFVFGGAQGGLFKLSDATARHWLADLLSTRISEFGLDCYRNDFNMDPLAFWRAADSPDRQGITEIRYVEGQYALWDELRARHPGLYIDNCSSGGRRIDLETLTRSLPLWRSDTGCAPGHADWDQTQAVGLGLYVPLFTACAWEDRAYVLRSAATAGIIGQFDYLAENFSTEQARAAMAEAKDNRKFWYGDFYPLTPARVGTDAWAAWQLHRSDLHAGIVLAFRRGECPYPVLQADLHAIRTDASYRVEIINEARAREERTVNGRELLSGFELNLPHKATSLLIRYAEL